MSHVYDNPTATTSGNAGFLFPSRQWFTHQSFAAKWPFDQAARPSLRYTSPSKKNTQALARLGEGT